MSTVSVQQPKAAMEQTTAGPAGPPTSAADQRPSTGDGLRTVMRLHPAGVVVITACLDRPTGFCATSLTSVSLDPPTVSFAVSMHSASGQTWASTQHGIVHMLGAEQREVALAFARPGPEKFAVGWSNGPEGQPLLDGVQAWLLIRPLTRLEVGDHLVVIAEVEASNCTPGQQPLIYHDGTFYALPV